MVELSAVQITYKLHLSKYLTGIYLWNVFAAHVSTTIWAKIAVEWNSLTVLNWTVSGCSWLSASLLLRYTGLHLHLFPQETLFYLWQQPKYVCKGLKVLFKVSAEIGVCQKMVLLGCFYLRKILLITKINLICVETPNCWFVSNMNIFNK